MSGRRARGSGSRPLEELVRLACSTDPQEPERRPRRVALAPRAAACLGALLIVLAVVLTARAVLTAPGHAAGSAATTSSTGSRAADGDDGAGAEGATPSPQGASALTPSDPNGSGAASASGTRVSPGASSAAGSGTVIVHVAGAVVLPGVVSLASGARVVDALEAAGGAAADADTDQLNLARVLTDGERVRVPRQGEDASSWGQDDGGAAGITGTEGSGTSGSGGAAGTGGGGGAGSGAGSVRLNTATAAELESLPGIGPALAQRIVDHREKNGPFGSVDELTEVPGIGTAKMEALRDAVTL